VYNLKQKEYLYLVRHYVRLLKTDDSMHAYDKSVLYPGVVSKQIARKTSTTHGAIGKGKHQCVARRCL
jgi:hypothetical protein